jgi:hypothetical protein
MRNLTQILSKDKNQRIINGIIFLILLIWIISKLRYVHLASDIRTHYKYDLLKLIALIYFAQTILNRIWLNSIALSIYVVLIGYIVYSYVYSFFDENDFVMQQEYGVLIKSLGTLIKLTLLIIIIWFTKKTRPILINTSKTK